jgi:hypothetical protein
MVAAANNTDSPAGAPARRLILLGASNLTRGIGTVVETALRLWGGPLEIMVALGHGRSYGLRKAFLWRELPGITACGLWDALARRPALPTAALVTDIGNDLLYEVAVPEIDAWVQWCLDRVQNVSDRVVMTPLPLFVLHELTRTRYHLLRRIIFPGSRLDLRALTERAHDLDRRVRDSAARRKIPLVETRPGWYGYDRIHFQKRHEPRAWSHILAGWGLDAGPIRVSRPSLWRWLYLRRLRPELRWLFGREQRRTQPAGLLSDGSTVAYY